MKNELQKRRLMFHELLIKMKNGVTPDTEGEAQRGCEMTFKIALYEVLGFKFHNNQAMNGNN